MESSSVISLTAAFLAALLYFISPFSRKSGKPIPVVGEGNFQKARTRYLRDGVNLVKEGYMKFRNGIFQIAGADNIWVVVTDKKLIEELKAQPDDVVSISDGLGEVFAHKQTNINLGLHVLVPVIRKNATTSLNRLTPALADEAAYVMQKHFPPYPDWTPLTGYALRDRLGRMVAGVSARLFAGEDLCRNEEWIEISYNYSINAVLAARAIRNYQPWIRPFVSWRLPEMQELRKAEAAGRRFFGDMLAKRQAARADPNYQEPDDLVEWLFKESGKHAADANFQTEVQLGATIGTIGTTLTAAHHALYDLAAYPEYVPILREEIAGVLQECGGTFDKANLEKLKKLDSFMKESQRMNSLGTTFMRKLLRPLTLTDGTHLPTGAMLSLASAGVSHDPALFPSPSTFNGLRYYDLAQREPPAAASRHQFVSSSATYLAFGTGRHVCPGKFLAATELKLLLADIIMRYDVRLEDGAEGRYRNVVHQTQQLPDLDRVLLFRDRA